MLIAGITKSSFIDYPGLVSCVLFVPGCNFDCFYCHNRPLIDGDYDLLDNESIMSFLKKRAGFLDAVVITGGEPTLQPDLISYMETINGLGYLLKLDTNGSLPDVIKRIINLGLCDYFAVDYKAPAARYEEICGGSADKVLETINLLLDSGARFEVRTTVIPQLTELDILAMAKELPTLPIYVLNRYRKPDVYLFRDRKKVEKTPYSKLKIEEFKNIIRPFQPNVV